MFYRIDYQLALIAFGLLTGAELGRRLRRIQAHTLARLFYLVIAVRLVIGAGLFTCSLVLSNAARWNKVLSVSGDIGSVLFGMLFGTALTRRPRWDLLHEPEVYYALCLSTGFGFVTAGFVKAFYMQGMTEFFTTSGYSLSFLKLIMTLEVLGGFALLIPWAALPATAALSVDMFGAIYTHIHNGDPANDSTGAVGQLLRLGAIALLWALTNREARSSIRYRLAAIGAAAVLCVAVAVAGGAIARHKGPEPPGSKAVSSLRGFPEPWRTSGEISGSSRRRPALSSCGSSPQDGQSVVATNSGAPPDCYLASDTRGCDGSSLCKSHRCARISPEAANRPRGGKTNDLG